MSKKIEQTQQARPSVWNPAESLVIDHVMRLVDLWWHDGPGDLYVTTADLRRLYPDACRRIPMDAVFESVVKKSGGIVPSASYGWFRLDRQYLVGARGPCYKLVPTDNPDDP